jgi:hypothetical protein
MKEMSGKSTSVTDSTHCTNEVLYSESTDVYHISAEVLIYHISAEVLNSLDRLISLYGHDLCACF